MSIAFMRLIRDDRTRMGPFVPSQAAGAVPAEQRREPRFQTDQAVGVTLLTRGEIRIPGRITNLSGNGLELRLDRPLEVGDPVKVQWDETLLLGDVRYCRRLDSQFAAGICVEHALFDLGWIARQEGAVGGAADSERSA